MNKKPTIPAGELRIYIISYFCGLENGAVFTPGDIYENVCKRARENNYRLDGTEKEEIYGTLKLLLFSHAVVRQPNGLYRVSG